MKFPWKIIRNRPVPASLEEVEVDPDELSGLVRGIIQEEFKALESRVKEAMTTLNRIERKTSREIAAGELQPNDKPPADPRIAAMAEIAALPEGADLPAHLKPYFQ